MKKLQALFCALLVCTLLLSGLPRTASAAYPDRPVTIIIPFGPGGAVDICRILGKDETLCRLNAGLAMLGA